MESLSVLCTYQNGAVVSRKALKKFSKIHFPADVLILGGEELSLYLFFWTLFAPHALDFHSPLGKDARSSSHQPSCVKCNIRHLCLHPKPRTTYLECCLGPIFVFSVHILNGLALRWLKEGYSTHGKNTINFLVCNSLLIGIIVFRIISLSRHSGSKLLMPYINYRKNSLCFLS